MMRSLMFIIFNVLEATVVLAGLMALAYFLKADPIVLYGCAVGYYVAAKNKAREAIDE